MTIIDPKTEYWPGQGLNLGLNQGPPDLRSCMLLMIDLHSLSHFKAISKRINDVLNMCYMWLKETRDWLKGVICCFQHFSYIMATVHLFMYFLGFTSNMLVLWSVLTGKNQTQCLQIISSTLYHCATKWFNNIGFLKLHFFLHLLTNKNTIHIPLNGERKFFKTLRKKKKTLIVTMFSIFSKHKV